MKRVLSILVLLALACIPALAEPGSQCTILAVTRCRIGPGFEYDVMATFPSGSIATLLDTMGDWCYIEISGQTYWIHSKYVRQGVPEPSATLLPPSMPAGDTLISLDTPALSLASGQSQQIYAATDPFGEGAYLTWASSDEQVAKVQGGMVLALNPGSAVITATARDGAQAVCPITVTPDASAPAASFTPTFGPANESRAIPIGEYIETYGSYVVDRSTAYMNQTTSIPVEAHCAVDGNETTAWNTDGDGTGQWISLTTQHGQVCRVTGIRLINGYAKSDSAWTGNARIAELSIYCDGTFVEKLTLADTRDEQAFVLTAPMTGSTFQFVIDRVYPGEKYEDCALTELVME